MKKNIVLIIFSVLFFVGCSEAQRKTERPLPKVHKGAAGSLVQPVSNKAVADWNAIHRTYAAKKYQLKDSWELVSYYDYSVTENEKSLEELQNMKIQILGDSILLSEWEENQGLPYRPQSVLYTNGMHLTTPI